MSQPSLLHGCSIACKMRLSVKIPSSPATAMTAVAEEREPLSPMAALFRQNKLNCHIVFILGFRKLLTANEIKAGLEATLLHHPRFSSVQVADSSWWKRIRWVPTKVKLDDHLVFADPGPAAVAAARDPTVGDFYVENYTAGLSRSPLDSSRPLWDLHILAIRTSEAAGIAVLRLHHSLGDGISIMSLLHACTRRTSDPESLPSLPETRRRPAAVAVSPGASMFLCWIWSFAIYAWNTLVEVFVLVFTVVFLKDTKTPIMAKEGIEYRPRRFVHRTLSLDDVIGIKNTIGCTINDVMVGITSAALSRYLSRNYGGHIPKHLRIRTAVLVNVRPIPGIHSLADMMKKDSEAKWGNRIGYFLLGLHVMKCEDPLDYIRKVAAITKKKKKSMAAIFAYESFVWIYKSLGIKVMTAVYHKISSNVTLTFSNIVGPREEVCFCGSPLVYIAPSIYGNIHALTIHVQSYLNKIKFVASVDEHTISDPHKFLDDITDSLQILKDAATSST